MNKTLLQSDLFLGSSELNQMVGGISSYISSLVSNISGTFGVVKKESDTNFNALKVVIGSTNDKITVKSGTCIDNITQQTIISTDLQDVLTVPNDSTTYYVVLTPISTYKEKGTVSINEIGEVTGVGTAFTKFRVGDYPTKLKFINSQNDLIYEVASVSGADSCTLVGSTFIAESGKEFYVYGTFTQGVTPNSQYLYQYDFYTLSLQLSPANDTSAFNLASVVNNGGVVSITDLRKVFKLNNIYTKSETDTLIADNVGFLGENNQGRIDLVTVGESTLAYVRVEKNKTFHTIVTDNSGGNIFYLKDITDLNGEAIEDGNLIILNLRFTYHSSDLRILVYGDTPINWLYNVNPSHSWLSPKLSNTISYEQVEPLLFFKSNGKWILLNNSDGLDDYKNIWRTVALLGSKRTLGGGNFRQLSYRVSSDGRYLELNGSYTTAAGDLGGTTIFTLPNPYFTTAHQFVMYEVSTLNAVLVYSDNGNNFVGTDLAGKTYYINERIPID